MQRHILAFVKLLTLYDASRHQGTCMLQSQVVVGATGATCRKWPCSSNTQQACNVGHIQLQRTKQCFVHSTTNLADLSAAAPVACVDVADTGTAHCSSWSLLLLLLLLLLALHAARNC